ncbi:MAG: hypothetical protein AAGI17_09890 [Planctomycetota bacterium]
MALLLSVILIALIVLILGVVLNDYLTGRTELFTHRNIFLAGMIYFQIYNAIPVLFNPVAERYTVQDVESAGQIYVLWATISVITYLVAYNRVDTIGRVVNKIRTPATLPSDTTIWLIILTAIPLSAGLRFGVQVPYLGVLLSFIGLALTCAAAGLAAWQWSVRFLNPVVAFLTLGVFVSSATISSIGEFSRRPLLSVIFVIGWGFYYGRFRYLRPLQVLPRVAVLGSVGVIAISLFTVGGRSLTGFTKLLNPREAIQSVEYVTETYSTARYALWLIDANYEQDRELTTPPLLTITYAFLLPVPRAIWVDKPYTVSTYMADWSDQQGVKRGRGGVTQPAGMLGNSAAEGGTWTVPLIAIFLALLTRFFDVLTLRDPTHPIVAIGAATMLGQAFGLARGETPVLAFSYWFGQLSAFFILLFVAKTIDRILGKDHPSNAVFVDADDGFDEGGEFDDGDGPWLDEAQDAAEDELQHEHAQVGSGEGVVWADERYGDWAGDETRHDTGDDGEQSS